MGVRVIEVEPIIIRQRVNLSHATKHVHQHVLVGACTSPKIDTFVDMLKVIAHGQVFEDGIACDSKQRLQTTNARLNLRVSFEARKRP